MRILGPLLLLALLAGCGEESGSPPTAAPDELLTTVYPVTVLDDGEGAELCLGGIATSLPPQCGGPKLLGWDWADVDESSYEQLSGVRWGEFAVTGTYDGTDLTPTEIVSAADFDGPDPPPYDPRGTSCPEPAGGWPVASSATSADVDATFRRADGLEGYGGAWLDTSRDGRTPEEMDQDLAAGRDDVSAWTINVQVTGDPADAEAELRQIWPGALCVTRVEHTERELRRIQGELQDEVPDILSSGSGNQQVEIQVVYDDGSLQQRLDDEYGEGVVVVQSALQPAE